MLETRGFRDSVVVITGAGSGIGRATALAFAGAGACLHLVDIRLDRLEEAREEARRGGARRATSHAADCTDAEAVSELARRVFAEEGRVDVLQNGVGVVVASPVEKMSLADWQRAVDHNLWSVIHGVRAFVPPMLAQGSPAHIVNIASVAGLVGFPFTAAYSASKAAVVGLSEALGAELSWRGIGVTAVCPGMVRTRLLDDGVLRLPEPWGERLRWLHDHLAPTPDTVARQILSAVRRKSPLVVYAPGFRGVWWSKRVSAGLYHRLASAVARLA